MRYKPNYSAHKAGRTHRFRLVNAALLPLRAMRLRADAARSRRPLTTRPSVSPSSRRC